MISSKLWETIIGLIALRNKIAHCLSQFWRYRLSPLNDSYIIAHSDCAHFQLQLHDILKLFLFSSCSSTLNAYTSAPRNLSTNIASKTKNCYKGLSFAWFLLNFQFSIGFYGRQRAAASTITMIIIIITISICKMTVLRNGIVLCSKCELAKGARTFLACQRMLENHFFVFILFSSQQKKRQMVEKR